VEPPLASIKILHLTCAADLVGPTGADIGIDANPELLDTARERMRASGLTNVCFICGDLHGVALDDFDAVLGRLI
jgi:ubiquinone/menaquinone biosynthesis C-methylase UbiE